MPGSCQKPKPKRPFRLPHPQPVNALEYARFTGLATFMRLPHITQPEELDIAIIGVPFDGGTTYRPGPRFGPRYVSRAVGHHSPLESCLEVEPV